ncbi:substrate-binding domain-containing protein [Streptomyces sp.]|uniref:LacI family DNA-binding transcriptional regulator n=2 Tax=Streptomyces sp. TaxID=1931 RepID=UPI0028113055|nr:substrate-binding domain-containing protein [Streptomyces sp.]
MGDSVTLREIADRLGLHVSTVSRVLHGSPDARQRAASARTARRVEELATELGYRPNPHATSLRTRRSRLIGVLFPRLSEVVVATIYEGIEEEATARGFSTFVTNTHDDPATQRERIEMVLARRVDGLIIGDAHLDGAALAGLERSGTPFVLVNRRTDGGHPAVVCDDRHGGRLVAEHFLGLGHRRVGVIAGEAFASTGTDRTAGFADRYREAGLPLPPEAVRACGFDTAGGRRAATELLTSVPRPTALFAVNDLAAIGAMGAARDLGLRVGADLALAGFNDVPVAAELPVPLTSVHSPMKDLGRTALRELLRHLSGDAPAPRRLPAHLTVRASSGSPIGPAIAP